MAYCGCQLKIETEEYTYFGTCYHHNSDGIGLRDVTLNGEHLPGVRMFYQYGIKNIEVLSKSQDVEETVEDKNMKKPVWKKHTRPMHLNKLQNLETSDIIGMRQLDAIGSETLVRRKPELVCVNERLEIESCDSEFDKAVVDILKEDVIGLAAEGENLSRKGKLFWLQVATKKGIYLFDILSLGADGFAEGLKLILESRDILKVIHNCRGLSDILFHIYGVKLDNVFDTQMASIISYRVKCGGDLPRYCDSLEACLKNVLNLSEHDTAFTRIRKLYIEIDQQTYAKRPLPDPLKDVLISNVMYLLDLRVYLTDLMLADFYYGVSLYLNALRDAPEGDISRELANMYMVPKRLSLLNEQARQRREQSRKQDTYSDGFQENCSGIVDPSIVYSKDIWHRSYSEERRKPDTRNSLKNFPIDPNQWHVPDLLPINMKKNEDFDDSIDSDTAKKDFWGSKAKHADKIRKPNVQPKTVRTEGSTTDVIKFRPAGMLQKVSQKFQDKSPEGVNAEQADSEHNIWRQAEEMRLKEEQERKLLQASSKSSTAQGALNKSASVAKLVPKNTTEKTGSSSDVQIFHEWADTDVPTHGPKEKLQKFPNASNLHDPNIVKHSPKPILDTLCNTVTSKPLRSNGKNAKRDYSQSDAMIDEENTMKHVSNGANTSDSLRKSMKKNRPRTLAEISARGISVARENKCVDRMEGPSNLAYAPGKQNACISRDNTIDLKDSGHVNANSFFALNSRSEIEKATQDKGAVINVEPSVTRFDDAVQDDIVTAAKLSNSFATATDVGITKSPLLQTPPDYMRINDSPELCVSKNSPLETQSMPIENRSVPAQLGNLFATVTNDSNTADKRKSPLLETPPISMRVNHSPRPCAAKDLPREERTAPSQSASRETPYKINDYVQPTRVLGKNQARVMPGQVQEPIQVNYSPKPCVSKDLPTEKNSTSPQSANEVTYHKTNDYAQSKRMLGKNRTQTLPDHHALYPEKQCPSFPEDFKAAAVFNSGHFTPGKQENFVLSPGIGRGQALKNFLQDQC